MLAAEESPRIQSGPKGSKAQVSKPSDDNYIAVNKFNMHTETHEYKSLCVLFSFFPFAKQKKQKTTTGMTLSKMSSASQWDLVQLKSGNHRKATELSQRPDTNKKFLEFLMDCSWSLNHATFTPS